MIQWEAAQCRHSSKQAKTKKRSKATPHKRASRKRRAAKDEVYVTKGKEGGCPVMFCFIFLSFLSCLVLGAGRGAI
jgi:hypothetical protein